jgi:hypothetical protein
VHVAVDCPAVADGEVSVRALVVQPPLEFGKSVKVTVPVGSAPPEAPATVTVYVTGWPTTGLVVVSTTEVVVGVDPDAEATAVVPKTLATTATARRIGRPIHLVI